MNLMKNNHSFYQGHEPFVAKIQDEIRLSRSQYRPVVTSFLSPVEWTHLEEIITKDTFLYMNGGYSDAQRKVAVFSPFEIKPDFPIDILFSKVDTRFRALSHRDVLGALMHLGIERDRLGDLIVNDDGIVIICKRQLSEYICDSLYQIGKCPVRFGIQNDMEIHNTGYEEILVHSASLRMDAIVAQLAHCSRSKAAAQNQARTYKTK